MLSSFIIALREGLEAALIVGILIAFISKSGKSHLGRYIWIGVGAAVALSLGLGALLNFTSAELTPKGETIFAGTTSILAVVVVTWMVFWMKRTARHLRRELGGKVDQAVLAGPLALAGAAFLAVVREGLETSLFVYANFKSVAHPINSALGLIAGFGIAIALGYSIYKSSINLNLAVFFKYTGIGLIIVAAGVLSYGLREFQNLGIVPGGDAIAWDVTSVIGKDSVTGAVLTGTVGFDTTTTWLQFGVYAAYLVAVLAPYLSKGRQKRLINA